MAHAIDTLALFYGLKSYFTEDQAHELSKALRQVEEARLDELATKQDLLDLKRDLLGLKDELATKQELLGLKDELATKQELLDLKNEVATKQELLGLKQELTNLETRIDAKLAALEGKIIKWIVGLAVALFSALIAILLKLP